MDERHNRTSDSEEQKTDLQQRLLQKEQELLKEKSKVHLLREEYDALSALYQSTLQEMQQLKQQNERISRSPFWRATAPFRFVAKGLMAAVRAACLRLPGLRHVYPYLAACRMFGRKVVRFNLQHYGTLDGTKFPYAPTVEQALAQKNVSFDAPLLFSIVCPLYNTPAPYLRELLQSVIGQTYPNWELCLADGSDATHEHVRQIVCEFQKKEPRIHYTRLSQNEGIAGNTNAALDMAKGDFIALLDHDDILNINALYEMHCAIENEGADFVYSDECTFIGDEQEHVTLRHFKPDFAPDTLRSNNYICHFTVFSKRLLEKVGGFRHEYDGSQDYDMVLRLTEQATHVAHVPKLLYGWRSHGDSVASDISVKPYAVASAIQALSSHLERLGLTGVVHTAPGLDAIYKIDYAITETSRVSVIVPVCEEADVLRRCLDSVLDKTGYPNYEIILAANENAPAETLALCEKRSKENSIHFVRLDKLCSPSALSNTAAAFAKGEVLLFLNGNTEVTSPNWLEEMLMFAQRPDVGAVGAKLYRANETLWHAGLVLGMEGCAGHSQKGAPRCHAGYMGMLKYSRNVSAVSGACLMVRREVFVALNGFDETFSEALHDVDLCLRLRKAGYLNVFTPYAELYCHEGEHPDVDSSEDAGRFRALWDAELQNGDAYYNRNFSRETSDIQFLPYVR